MNERAPDIEAVKIMPLQPGDVIVVESARRINAEQAEDLRARVEHWFPGHKVIVVSPSIELAIVRPE